MAKNVWWIRLMYVCIDRHYKAEKGSRGREKGREGDGSLFNIVLNY